MSKPILTLRKGEAHQIPPGKTINIRKPNLPTVQRQQQRLEPRLKALTDAMENQRALLQKGVNGIDPEMVLVFEVIGDINNFIKAARKVGMEWLGDIDSVTDPDDDFYSVDNQGNRTPNSVKEKLYLTLTNSEALKQLLSLWRRYTRNENKFPTGFAPFKELFSHLRDIRKWDYRDRFIETNVIEVWENLLESRPEKIHFEIELWFRSSAQKRSASEDIVRNILAEYKGTIVRSVIYEEIAYHGLIAVCPADEIRQMIDNTDNSGNSLINAEQIMWIRAAGQVITRSTVEDASKIEINIPEEPLAPPTIALLDGLPSANHSLLRNRLIINDPDDYGDLYPAQQRNHGTTMASLIIYGDLNDPVNPLNEKIYVRPIMRPDNHGDESIPDTELFVDVLHRAVREIVDSPELSSIRFINLSIGNNARPFFNTLSPEAKMLDWLSHKYSLLFLVSTGNKTQNLHLDIKIGELKELSTEKRHKQLYDYIWDDAPNMRILSPAESVNSLTVGALHKDSATTPDNPGIIDPVMDGYPALYSRYGGGYDHSIKPDFLNVGGRLLYSHLNIDSMPAKLYITRLNNPKGPGMKVAVPTNGLNDAAYTCGSSNATAISSRTCSYLLKVVRNIPHLNLPVDYEAIAVKAMFIHSCKWGEMGTTMMNRYVPQTPRTKRGKTLKMIGYGYPEPDDVTACTDQRTTLIGYGEIRQNQQIEFSFPLPPCLISEAVKKRLTITLAWFSPVNPNGKNYRLARLSFESPNRKIITEDRSDADTNSSRHGTVQHEIFEGKQASIFEDGEEIKILVKCKREEKLPMPVRFVILATLETAPETGLPIYDEIQTRIKPQVKIGN